MTAPKSRPKVLEALAFNVRETAGLLRCSEGTVRELLRTGKLRGRGEFLAGEKQRKWFISKIAIEAFLAGKPQ